MNEEDSTMFGKLWKVFVSKMKLMEMDKQWYLMGGICFGLFPPSFFHTHSEEEIKRCTDEIIMEIEKLLEELKANAKR